MFLPLRWSLPAFCTLALAPLSFGAVELKQEADKVTVTIDGKLFTEYHFAGARRPYFYPIIGPTGGTMTRHWPLQDDIPTEDHDHPHHKGLWYGHRVVNGIDFWGDTGKAGTKMGKQIQDGAMEIKSGDDVGVVHTHDKWVFDDTGEVICTDERTLKFHKGKDGPMIDFDITIKAGEKPVVFNDDKDGIMAIRVPETMRVDKPRAKGEKTAQPGDGHIVTSEGKKDGAAWGTRADWCDYYGPVEGKIAGVAMFDHPSNPRHPTWWHVRTYGLFAANPYGQAQFEKLPDKAAGDYKIAPGESISYRYRFYFHAGDTEQAKVAEHYHEYIDKQTAATAPAGAVTSSAR
ncbi:MAG TPA: PmoA family protein [Chthoniobacter sp.]|jgi:hypothetical protein